MSEEIDLKKILNTEVGEQEIRSMIADYCSINVHDLDTALSRQASLFSYAVAGYEMAKVDETEAKWEAEKAKAECFGMFADMDGEKAVAAKIDKKVLTAPLYQQAFKKYRNAMAVTARLKALVSGFEHRKDMLVQISARQRQEMAGG